jgi:hypothetical protein
MAEPVNFTFHYGAQSWPITKEQADRLTLLLSRDVRDGKTVVTHLAELPADAPGRLP